ncbi:MAG TPA: SpoIVB peptidase S55 domain-containing protein [Polyangia bacterium]|nr:SpoIVB peptidase S55 domain-containing protein [Polyangia bacterium]
MHRPWLSLFFGLFALSLPVAASAANTKGVRLRAVVPSGPPPAIMPLSDVKPGMVGQALTVFQGTKPEPFKVRVVSVMHNFLPKQDVILIRAEDPRVEFSGIVAGMSGSPVYIDGKLVGAVAYAWSFAKEPLGGVTPIESMLAERRRPRRVGREYFAEGGPDNGQGQGKPGGQPGGAESLRIPAAMSGALTQNHSGFGSPDALSRGLGLPPIGPAPANGEPRLLRASVPLTVSGFSPRAVGELAEEMRPTGLVPLQAGGGGHIGPPAAGHVEPGSAIGVELVRGDMSTVATGTVTYVNGSDVLAFGHPLFGIGEVYLPMVDAEIHAFLPSLSQSFKMSSPLNEVGTLVQDRPACIVGDLDARTTMLPVDVRVTGPGVEPRLFHAEVARNRRLTPMLASTVVSNAIADAEPDVTDMIVTVTSKVGVKGYAPLELRDQIFSPEGVSSHALASSRGLRAMDNLLVNPFEPVTLDRLDVDVRVEYRRDVAEIVGVALPTQDVHAGDTVDLRVTLRPYAGSEYVETVPVIIPRTVAGQTLKIEVASGASVRPDVPQAETLPVYIDNMRKSYSATSLVVTLQTQDDGASLRGRLISGLPDSALDTLRPGNQTNRAGAYHIADRTLFPARQLVSGREELSVAVKTDALGAVGAIGASADRQPTSAP